MDRIPLASLVEQPSEGRSASKWQSTRFATDLSALHAMASAKNLVSGAGSFGATSAAAVAPS